MRKYKIYTKKRRTKVTYNFMNGARTNQLQAHKKKEQLAKKKGEEKNKKPNYHVIGQRNSQHTLTHLNN